MECSCGTVNTVEAATKEEAIAMLKAGMTAENIAAHMADKHPGDPVPPVEAAHAMIEQQLVEA
jgi:hypothetical protein